MTETTRARIRHLVVRGSLLVTLALLTAATMLIFMAWLALRIDWNIPDPAALTGPTVLVDRHGTEIARFTAEVDRRIVPLDAVSPAAREAIVAAEDVRFREHGGVDPLSLVRAVVTNVRTGGISQGGSTLTQQYVKNAFLTPERNVVRKVREAVISIQLERTLTKDEILERYLNAVYFGEGAYGIEAAALTYFAKSASALTAAEGATLAQLLPAPSQRNPRADPDGALARRDRVLRTMHAAGMLTTAELDEAVATDLIVQPRRRPPVTAPFFTEYVRKQVVAAYGERALLTGGLRVTVTLDADVQQALEDAVAARLPADEVGRVDAGAVAIDPATGNILGIYGGRDFGEHQFDLATQGRRQNGSAFKPVVYLTALMEGLEEGDTRRAPASITIRPDQCVEYDGPPIRVRGGPGGRLTLREALIRSVNTVYIQLGCELGPEPIIRTAALMGVRNEIPPAHAVALGGSAFGASVLDMASMMATLANDGVSCPARSIAEVIGPDGETLASPVEVTIVPDMERRTRVPTAQELGERPESLAARDRAGCHGALAADHARMATQALQEVVRRTTGQRADIGRPQAGKTGTTNDNKDAWFAGYTPDLSLAVWIGDPDFERDGVQPLLDVGGFRRVEGGSIPALIWHDAAAEILADVPASDFLEVGEGVEGSFRRPGPPNHRPTPTTEPDAEPTSTPTPTLPPATEPTETPTRPRPCIPLLTC